MGWLPSFLGGEKSSSNIDPELRDFLNKEAPTKYTPAEAPAPTQQAQTRPSPSIPQNNADGTDRPQVPRESLYQDGRYAHLWKTYQPKAQIEAENTTEHDKMTDLLENFKERKIELQAIALENCADQQEEWTNCMKHGKIEDQLQMCRHQVRRFERCYTMQTRFLRALGYGSAMGRPASVDEDIQMHADALYRRLLAHEAEAEKAKEEGRPIPVFDPAVPGMSKPKVEPPQDQQLRWQEALNKLPEDERAAERAALVADWQAKSQLAARVKGMKEEEKREREAKGQPSFLDFVGSVFSGGK
ncbi:hypothetical protein CC79DRAFT_1326632 [Sarocladium strictum]